MAVENDHYEYSCRDSKDAFQRGKLNQIMQSITIKYILSLPFSSIQRTITTNAKILFSVGGIIKSYILISFFFKRKDINQVKRWKNILVFNRFIFWTRIYTTNIILISTSSWCEKIYCIVHARESFHDMEFQLLFIGRKTT